MDRPERLSPGSLPGGEPDPDPEWSEYQAWLDREIAAGRDPDHGCEPEVWELGDWDAWDPPATAALSTPPAPAPAAPAPASPTTPPPAPASAPAPPTSPAPPTAAESAGIAAESAGTAAERRLRFGQGDEADVLPPGPLLSELTEEAVRDFGGQSDDELIGVLQAARRQEVRESYKQVLAVAEFARRRVAEFEAARAEGLPVAWRPGGFPGEELAMELVTTRIQAGRQIDMATDLVTRLPATLAGMAAGLIDEARASWISFYTHCLSAEDAARADEILAAVAPDLRVDQLARKAAALEMKLDPAAARARKEHEKRTNQRVEARREASGNASLSAREMETVDAIASKSYIDAMAAALRRGGLDAPLGALRVLAMSDLTQGRNPLDRVMQQPTENPEPAKNPKSPENPEPTAPGSSGGGADGSPPADLGPIGVDPTCGASPVPLPALINLVVPAATLFGWDTAQAKAGTWGLLDHVETHSVVTAASQHPRTRWCVTLTNESGEAIAHACARGRYSWLAEGSAPPPDTPIGRRPRGPGEPVGRRDGPAQEQSAMLHDLIRGMDLAFRPIARGTCDHAHAEVRYTPSRRLKHLIRARTANCDAPGCNAQAIYADLDHTVPHPAGPTDECNLSPRCRTHHRCKQAPDWRVEQAEPGVTRWTLPSGRIHITKPTIYPLS